MTTCNECGMQVRPGEYHPHGACLMFKGCQDANTVRASMISMQGRERKLVNGQGGKDEK